MKSVLHFLASLLVAMIIVTTATFIYKVCTYTPLWLDYVIWVVSSTIFIYVLTKEHKK